MSASPPPSRPPAPPLPGRARTVAVLASHGTAQIDSASSLVDRGSRGLEVVVVGRALGQVVPTHHGACGGVGVVRREAGGFPAGAALRSAASAGGWPGRAAGRACACLACPLPRPRLRPLPPLRTSSRGLDHHSVRPLHLIRRHSKPHSRPAGLAARGGAHADAAVVQSLGAWVGVVCVGGGGCGASWGVKDGLVARAAAPHPPTPTPHLRGNPQTMDLAQPPLQRATPRPPRTHTGAHAHAHTRAHTTHKHTRTLPSLSSSV